MRVRSSCLIAVTIFGLLMTQRAGADQLSGMKLWTAKKYTAAFHELMPLAEAGDPVAEFTIGMMFSSGRHVTQDLAAAAGWWRRSAERGYGPAQLRLAVVYWRGDGVSPDPGEAFHWASLARANELAPQDASVTLWEEISKTLPADVRRAIDARIAVWAPRRAPMPGLTGTSEALRKRGSGFFVDDRGHVLTNYHVIDHCGVLRRVGGAAPESLTLVAADATRDLALLRMSRGSADPVALSSQPQIDLGAPVVIVGFPISGGEAFVTNGIVNARAGGQGQRGLLQVSAAIASGQSGGPVLDQRGRVIGIAWLSASGTTTGQGGVAVALSVITAFLAENGVTPARENSGPALSTQEIASRGLRATVPIECWR